MPSGPRIRTDNVFGTVSDSPLLVGATTLNSAGLANLAAVSSAHAVIVLDPLRSAGAPEVVIVTAHTASATSATVTRGAYGTTARQHANGVLWIHAPTVEDVIRIVANAAALPSDPYRGQLVFQTDINSFVARDTNDAWQTAVPLGTWTNYTGGTPQSSSGSLTTVSGTGAWTRVGRTIFYRYTVTITTVGTGSGDIIFDLPTACNTNHKAFGAGREDGVTGGVLVVYPSSATRAIIRAPAALANGQVFDVTGCYEAAS